MARSLRILHVYKDYFPVLGGIENHVRVLAEAQVRAGHQVIALVCNLGSRTAVEELDGVKVVKSGRLATVASMPISLSQPVALSRLRPDVIHVHSPYPLGEVSAWLLGRKSRLVITHHSDVIRQKGLLRLYGPVLRRVLRHADRILTDSPNYMRTSAWLQPVLDKCVVVPLGVDPMRFTLPASPYAGPPLLLFVGRLRYYKGLDTLLRALAGFPDVALSVVGEGPMRSEWEGLAASLGIASRVRFAGEVGDDDLPGIYHQATAFVLPSNARSESFGVVQLEAMASGLPCVTTEVGTGTSWVVQDGVTGWVVPSSDPAALAGAIGRLLAEPALARQMGRAGRQRVEREFTESVMVDRVMAVYRELLGEI
jgi:glycosyltransferase involved in cell wall biosynthesis